MKPMVNISLQKLTIAPRQQWITVIYRNVYGATHVTSVTFYFFCWWNFCTLLKDSLWNPESKWILEFFYNVNWFFDLLYWLFSSKSHWYRKIYYRTLIQKVWGFKICFDLLLLSHSSWGRQYIFAICCGRITIYTYFIL